MNETLGRRWIVLSLAVVACWALEAGCSEDGSGLEEDQASDQAEDGSEEDATAETPDTDDPSPSDPPTSDDPSETAVDTSGLSHFSFFVTSLAALRELSGSDQGFGGDLRYGETGAGAGLRGADKICAEIAEMSMDGASVKQWRAFLSATADDNGEQVNAIERIGDGPWYDRLGRLLANDTSELLSDRPTSADPAIIDDLPNEDGVPNHKPISTQAEVDNHDMLTGTNAQGQLFGPNATCDDWTSAAADAGEPRIGHSWPRTGAPGAVLPPPGNESPASWSSAHAAPGCVAGVNLEDTGAGNPGTATVGGAGGYGGFYCFALVP